MHFYKFETDVINTLAPWYLNYGKSGAYLVIFLGGLLCFSYNCSEITNKIFLYV